jgi:hypothetical protein
MQMKVRAILIGLTFTLLLVPGSSFGQAEQIPAPANDKLPDWSGTWSMMGGTVFDRATQTGQGGAIAEGVRSHPPYNAEWEAVYRTILAL